MSERNGSAPILDEIAAVRRDPLFEGYIGRSIQNVDSILRRQSGGRGIDLYLDLELDGHLYSALQIRYLAVVGREWEIRPASARRQDQQIAQFVREAFLATNFDAGRLHMLSAIHRGYSVTEILWKIGQDGMVRIDRFLPRLPRRFVFSPTGELRLITRTSLLDGEPVPSAKFLVVTWGDQSGSRYGYGLGNKVYWPIWFKKNAIKFWVIFAEKFGSPTAVGKYPVGTEKAQQDVLLNVLKTIQQDTGLIMPDTMAIELLEAQRSGSLDTYERLVEYMDRLVSKIVLGQTLTTQPGEVGSLALGRIHNEVRLELVKADADALSEAINGPDGLIHWLVDFNFPAVQAYPTLWVPMQEALDLTQLAERDERLVKLGLPISANYFYTIYNIPRPAPDEPLVQALPASGPGRVPDAGPLPAAFAAAAPAADRALREEAQLQSLVQALLPQGQAAFDVLLAQIQRLLQPARPALAALGPALTAVPETISTASLAQVLATGLLLSQLLGRAQLAAAEPPPAFARVDLAFDPLDPEEVLAFFRARIPLTEAEFLLLKQALGKTAADIAEAQLRDLAAMMHQAWMQALAEGSTLPAFRQTVEQLFVSRGYRAPRPFHIETVFRTNLQTAYNIGRYQQMQRAVAQRPFWQYHAVDDRRTRPLHAALNGRVFPADSSFWHTWYPPNGMNCRCTVTSVSAPELEEYGLTVEPNDPTNTLIEPIDPRTGERLPAQPLRPDRGFESNPALTWQGL